MSLLDSAWRQHGVLLGRGWPAAHAPPNNLAKAPHPIQLVRALPTHASGPPRHADARRTVHSQCRTCPKALSLCPQGPHFWDEAAYPVRVKRAPGRYDGSFPAYIGIFDKPAQKIKANPNAITGEASSNTFTAVWSHLR